MRYVLPSCVVSAVRENFPDPEGEYTGFVCFSSESQPFCHSYRSGIHATHQIILLYMIMNNILPLAVLL